MRRHRSIRKAQVLTLMVVLVVATGMTAAPVRHALTPLIAHPLGAWLGHTPTAGSGVLVTGEPALAAESRDALDVPIGIPAPLSYSANGGHSAAEHLARAESETWSSAADNGGSRQSGRRLNDRFTELRQSRYGAGSFAFSRDVGSRVGAGTTGRNDSEESSRVTPSRSGSSAPSYGGGGASPDPKKDEKLKDPLFNEHKSGLPDLSGGHKGPKDAPGKAFGSGKVAVNPEPSTLFLFGTGIAFVAGALRRRLS